MATAKRFEDLEVWQQSRELAREVYKLTLLDEFSRDYKFVSQIRSSSGSVMDNIAEGFCRDGNAEFIQFLGYAKGSCGEVQSQLHRALDYGFINSVKHEELYKKADEVAAMITRFMKYLKTTTYSGNKFKK